MVPGNLGSRPLSGPVRAMPFPEWASAPARLGGAAAPLLEEVDSPSNRRISCRTVVTACGIVSLLALGSVFHDDVDRLLDAFVLWCQGLGWIAPVVFGLVVAALQLLMLPTFPLMVGAGVVFPRMFGAVAGQVVGVGAVFMGVWLGSMAAFCLGRYFLKRWAEAQLAELEWMSVINSMVEENGWWVVMLARASPLLPLEVFNYACALTSLSHVAYGVGCLGSLFPATIWVCSSASAMQAITAARSGDGEHAQLFGMKGRLAFLAFNIVFLVIVSSLLYGMVRQYQSKIDRHVEKHLDVHAERLQANTEQRRRQLQKQLSFSTHTLQRRRSSLAAYSLPSNAS